MEKVFASMGTEASDLVPPPVTLHDDHLRITTPNLVFLDGMQRRCVGVLQ
jgi:hypothetical protein